MPEGLSIRVDLYGVSHLLVTVQRAAEDALSAVALDGLAYAQRNMGPGSPNPAGSFPGIDSGTLIDGLHVTPHGPLHQTLDSSADYSIYLEYGTTRMGARPFMRPTARYMSQQAPRIVATVIGRHIR